MKRAHRPRALATLVGLALSAALVAGACTANQAVLSVTRETAVATAIGSSGSTTLVSVISATLTTYGAASPNGRVVPADTQVWAIRLSGTFPPGSCGPAPASGETPTPCPSPATSEQVLINAQSGAIIEAERPAP